jgi:hypothetical protein
VRARCALGTLKPGQAVRLFVRVKIVKDLPVRRTGKVETQAEVRSAEIDPQPDDNFDRELTTLVSRQPELAFLAPVQAADGQIQFVEREQLPNGERFGIGARFMHVLAEPAAPEVVVRLVVGSAQPVDVVLRRALHGEAVIYRSGPLPLRANAGDELRATYERASATAKVIGAR